MSIDLDLRTLRSFVAVGRQEHIGRAAAELFISQPALSKQMKKLELTVGVPLLERVGRRVRLTGAGKVMLDEAIAITGHADSALRRVQMSHLGANRSVTLAYIPPMESRYTTGLLRGAVGLGDIDVTLRRVAWTEKYPLLRSGDVDLALIRLPIDEPGLSYVTLHEETRVAAFGVDHALAGRTQITLSDIVNEPIADMSNQRDYWCANPRPDGSTPIFGPTVASVDEMLEVVAAGKCMCLTSSTVGGYYHRDDIVYIPVLDLSPARVVVAWIEELLTPSAARVRDAIVSSSDPAIDKTPTTAQVARAS